MASCKTCTNGCCSYQLKKYKRCTFTPKLLQKAGVFIYDKSRNKILLVQSRGNLWGPPKGSVELNESIIECALREVKEETGIRLTLDNISESHKFIFDNSHYYYCEMNEVDVTLDTPMLSDELNDASGIGWININCLINMVNDGTININYHCKLLLAYYCKISM